MKWEGGKGSRSRPLSVSRKTFESNWDRIFRKTKQQKQNNKQDTNSDETDSNDDQIVNRVD